ncbi:hypothetical protein GCK32_014609, partial [Trichostrongylus colubriformis]
MQKVCFSFIFKMTVVRAPVIFSIHAGFSLNEIFLIILHSSVASPRGRNRADAVVDCWPLRSNRPYPHYGGSFHCVRSLKGDTASTMQVRLHARNIFAFMVGAAFVYLAYMIFFKAGDGFPEIDVDLSNVVSYAVLAVEMGGYAVRRIHEEHALNIAQKGLT